MTLSIFISSSSLSVSSSVTSSPFFITSTVSGLMLSFFNNSLTVFASSVIVSLVLSRYIFILFIGCLILYLKLTFIVFCILYWFFLCSFF